MEREPKRSRFWLRNNNEPSSNTPNPLGRPNGNSPNPSPRGGLSNWIWVVIALILAIYAWQFFMNNNSGSNTNSSQVAELSYSDLYKEIDAKNIKNLTFVGQNDINGDFVNKKDGKEKFHVVQLPFNDATLKEKLTQADVTFGYKEPQDNSFWLNVLLNILPWVFLIGLFFFFSRRASQGQQGIFNFGKSRAKVILEDRPTTTFAEVAGVDEAKFELQEVVEFLKTPGKYQRLGGKIPRGVLLVGPPGTGKTLLARAVAGEAGVPFFSMSGSEFVEVLVGVGASRVRDLFEQAKKASPSIIFIDEIDAVGRQRGSSINSNDEREQTLNQLLVEMDGFDARQAVVVLAATNRPDGLDQALLRPGRFDRRVTVDRPDWNGRLAILKIHTREVPLDPAIDLVSIARATTGMVGADLANLVNEASLLAARRNLDFVDQRSFDEALDKILLGAERPLVLADQDLTETAYHEGGHALAGLLLEGADPVTKVTIVPRGQALGVTVFTPLDDRYNYSREYLLARIHVALAGRAAEEIVFQKSNTGASNDLERATQIARQMVTRWGMSERLGTISFSDRGSPFAGGNEAGTPIDYSEETAQLIDEEVEKIIHSSYEQVRKLLHTNRVTLDKIAEALRRYETIDTRQLHTIMEETGARIARTQFESHVHPPVQQL